MRRIFLDTNVVLDMLMRDEYKPQIRELVAQYSNQELFISYLTVANAAYIMRKYPKSVINNNIKLLLELFSIIPNDKNQIEEAIKQEVPDFEDMLQYQSAISANCDIILTRNVKDFPFAKIPIMNVQAFLGY